MIIDGAKVSYGLLDQSIEDDDLTDTSSAETELSFLKNTLNAATHDKIAYLEKNLILLDGSFIFAENAKNYNVGWESSAISDENGNINVYIEYTFQNLHDSYGVQITFPPNCVAKNFTIAYYNGLTLVGSTAVTDNTTEKYSNSDVRLNWNKVRITFTKINAQQRARLWDIVFGINDIYNEDMLLSISATRTTDLAGDYDDCGEFSFTFYNDGRFDIKDINDLPVTLQEGLQVIIYTKKQGSSEYLPFGVYYSNNTSSAENGTVITVSGYDKLYELNNSTFNKGIVYPNGRSLGAWAEEVAADAGITLNIDSAFYSIMSTGYITEVPHREALRLITEAGCGILVIDKNGGLYLKKHTPTDKSTLTADDIVDGSYNLQNTDKYLGVQVVKYTFSAAAEEQELGYLEEVLLTEEPQEIEITYNTFPAVVSTIQVFVDTQTSAQVSNVRIYSDRIVLNISGNEGDTTFITITGKPYNSATTTVTRGSTTKNIKKIESNYLITGSIADNVADHQYSRVVNKYKRSAEIITNKEFDLGDKIVLNSENAVQRLYSNNSGDSLYITKISFEMSSDNTAENVEGIDE